VLFLSVEIVFPNTLQFLPYLKTASNLLNTICGGWYFKLYFRLWSKEKAESADKEAACQIVGE
jgi:hypothetical protein